MNVLVAGGAGYIGSHAVKQLLDAGHRVVVVDNLHRGHRQAVDRRAVFHQIHLADIRSLADELAQHAIDCVMQFAALTYVGESVADPLAYYDNNTAGTISLLKAMKTAGVKRLVFSSTAAVYGEPETTPIVETMRQEPVNPYGWSKWCVERVLLDYAVADKDFSFVALRYFNVAGAAADGSLGEDHDPETHLIPVLLLTALGRREKVTVFGTDYPTPDGTCIRDYVHVEDLCAAHIVAMEALKPGDTRFYNLGIGRGYSVKEVIDSSPACDGRRFSRRLRPASSRRSSHSICQRRQDPPRTRLVGPLHRHRRHRGHSMELVQEASEGVRGVRRQQPLPVVAFVPRKCYN